MNKWSRAIENWINTKARRSQHTARAYRRAMDDFLEFIAPRQVQNVGGSAVAEWANDLAGRGLSDSTVAQRLAAVSSFYRFAMRTCTNGRGEPLAPFNPVEQVERPQVEQYGKSRPLTKAQVKDLLGVIDTSTSHGMRDRAMIIMALFTGRRSREIRNWRAGDIQHNANGNVRYRWRGKRNKSRWDDLPVPVWQAVQLYWQAANRQAGLNEPVFISHNGHGSVAPLSGEFFNQMVKRYAYQAGLPDWVTAHTLRHTASALRLHAGRGVLEINALLAHETLRTTQIYLKRMIGFVDEGWQDVAQELSDALP